MTDNLMKELLPEGGTQEELEGLVNVDTYVTENFPPVYLMTAEKDFLKEQAPLLEKVLKEKKFRIYIPATREQKRNWSMCSI